MDIRTVKPAIEAYIAKVGKRIKIDSVLLYGSLARGEAKANDVDLLVLSADFASMDADDRLKLLYRLSAGFPYDLHVYGFAPDEFKQASPLTAAGQIKNGRIISFLLQS